MNERVSSEWVRRFLQTHPWDCKCEECKVRHDLLDARDQIRDLIGADRPGPNSHCTDCGRAMVWTSERGESWICPYDVWRRMDRAEEAIERERQITEIRAARAAGKEER